MKETTREEIAGTIGRSWGPTPRGRCLLALGCALILLFAPSALWAQSEPDAAQAPCDRGLVAKSRGPGGRYVQNTGSHRSEGGSQVIGQGKIDRLVGTTTG